MDKIKVGSFILSVIRIVYYTVAAYGLFLVVMWWQDTDPPITFKAASVSKAQVRPGETIIVMQDLVKQRPCFGEVNRWLEGSCGYKPLLESNAVLAVGTHRLSIPIDIPTNFSSGLCWFKSRHHYICNPLDYILNRRVYYSPPIYFEVVK